jgi:hypothetical protein
MSLTVSLKEHIETVLAGHARFLEERDRRYTEVNIEREKALKIKETADLAALQLAREIQTYKDEKANELREQINSERGLYATNKDLEPLKTYIAAQTGRGLGITASAGYVMSVIMAIIAVAAIFYRT